MSNHGQQMVRESQLAEAYYARASELAPRIRERISAEMLREIFDRMVMPAVREIEWPEAERLRETLARAHAMLYDISGVPDHMTHCDRTMGATHPCTCGANAIRALLSSKDSSNG